FAANGELFALRAHTPMDRLAAIASALGMAVDAHAERRVAALVLADQPDDAALALRAIAAQTHPADEIVLGTKARPADLEAAAGARRRAALRGSLMAETRRILVASHDFKFFEDISAYLASKPGVEIREDRWTGTRPGDHDDAESRLLAEWADVVVCEWCQANAVWYSHNKRLQQRLIVRLHRFEIENDMPSLVDIDAV